MLVQCGHLHTIHSYTYRSSTTYLDNPPPPPHRPTYLHTNLPTYLSVQIDPLADPCPLPESEGRRSTLKTKETLLYAPMANVGAVKYDADAMYIDLRKLNYTKVGGQG